MQITSHRSSLRNGSTLNLTLAGVAGVLLLGTGAYFFSSGGEIDPLKQPLTADVFVGVFVKEVLDQGEIQSSDNFEIRCEVKSRYASRGVTVKKIFKEEGSKVTGGELLIQLQSDEIEASDEEQSMAVTNAKDAVTTAQNNLEAELVAKKEYVEGIYVEERGKMLNAISQAEEELEKALEFVKYSKKLQAKSFITRTQLRSDEAALDRAKRNLISTKQSLHVLDNYTLKKFEKEFDSKINIANSQLEAAKANLEIAERTYNEIQEQLAACQIRVPEGQSGQVVYANVFSRRGSAEFVLEEGATVREGQVLVKLPNPSKMQVRATVNESRVISIRPDLPVTIAVDALNGETLSGVVTKVNKYAEPEGWGGGGVRKFAVYIEILNPDSRIRPGMNASVTVEVERIPEALMIPVQAVYGYRGKTFCLVKNGSDWETREVSVATNNDSYVVIEEGLAEGDTVALNPAGYKDLLELPDLPEVEEEDGRNGNEIDYSSKSSKQKKSKNRSKKSSSEYDGQPAKESAPDQTNSDQTNSEGDKSQKTTSEATTSGSSDVPDKTKTVRSNSSEASQPVAANKAG